MIRQAQTYLVGARLSVALLAVALAAFVILGSLGGFSSFGVPGLGGDTSTPTLDGSSQSARNAALVLRSGAPPAGRREAAATRAPARAGGSGGPGNTPAGGNQGVGGGDPAAPGSGGSDPGGNGPANPTSPGGTGNGTGSGGGGTSTPAQPLGAATVKSAVDNTVDTLDHATGGALGQTGVPQVVHGATNGVLGPGSGTGQALDNAAGPVNNLLGGGK